MRDLLIDMVGGFCYHYFTISRVKTSGSFAAGKNSDKKISSLKSRKESVWFSFLLNALLLIGLLVVFRPVYETNDDYGLANMVNGVKGARDAHLIYAHYFLGLLLKVLYQLRQSVPWFSVLQYVVLYVSFTSITYVLTRRAKNQSTIWFSYLLIIWFAYEGYIKLQYTKTAGIASVAGILLLFYAVCSQRVSKRALAGGFALSCIGFMYRDAQFFAEAALMTGIGIYLLIELKDTQDAVKGQRQRKLFLYFGTFGGLLAAVVLLHFVDRSFYRAPEWETYDQFNEIRTELYDYGFPSYDQNEEAYRSLGIDKNAYDLLRGWNFMDTEKFTKDIFEKIAELKQPRPLDLQLVKAFLKKVPLRLLKVQCFYCFLLICLYWLLCGRHDQKNILSVLYEAVLVMAVYLFMFYKNRYLINRVDVGIWLAVSVVVLWTISDTREYFSGRHGVFVLLVVVALNQYHWKAHWRINSDEKISAMMNARAVVETVSQDKEHLYLMPVGTVSIWKSYGVFDSPPAGLTSNIFSVGGWTANSPLYLDVLKQYGVENPMKDFIGNENVYFFAKNINKILEYVRTYYKPDAEAIVVREINGLKAYMIK